MKRRASRETVMKLLYQLEIHKQDKDEIIASTISKLEEKLDSGYIESMLDGINEYISSIDGYINSYLRGWTIERISKVDLSILRLAIFEMIWKKDIPNSVSINEAVELAKKYSTMESSSYINGVLSKVNAAIIDENANKNYETDTDG